VTTPDDRDVKPSRLARELGITEQEAKGMRRAVELCEISAPQRYQIVGRVELSEVNREQ
jgi:hypothetical protein